MKMSWMNTLLDIGIMGMQANQSQKLHQLQQQQAGAAAVQALIQALRDEIFKYKQAADEVLAMEVSDPKAAVVAMRILYIKLQEFGVTPDIFPELSDKEYAASTIKLIQGNSERLMADFPEEEQSEIEQIASAVLNLPKYKYYIENFDNAQKYRNALANYKKYKTLNSGCLSWFVGYWVLSIIGAISFGAGMGIATVFSGGQEMSDGAAVFGVIMGMLIFIGGVILYNRKGRRAKEYKEARNIVEQHKGKLDLTEFAALENQFGCDYQNVLESQKKDQVLVDNFLEDKDVLQLLLG